MEQYNYQQQVIVEPAPAKKPIGLQVTALILGIVGMALAFVAYFVTIFSNIGAAAPADGYPFTQNAAAVSGVSLIASIVIMVLCLVALILSIAGLVKSIRRATRTVGGIIMSAIALNLSGAGFALSIVGMVIGGLFSFLIRSGAIH